MATGVRKKGGAYRLRLTLASGERVEITSSKVTLREATEERAQLIVRERAKRIGTWQGSEVVTLAEIWEEYSKSARTQRGFVQMESRVRLHVLPRFGTTKMLHISSADVEALLTAKEEEGYSPMNRRHIRAHLVVLFNWAKRARLYVGENPAALARAPRLPKKRPRFLEFKLVQDVIDAVPDRWRNFFALAVYTGLRSGELRGLTHADIESNHRGLFVERSGDSVTTKTGDARFVPLPKAALPYLEAAMKASEGRPWLFVDDLGEQVSRHTKFPDILRGALDALGLVTSYVAFCQRGCSGRVKGLRVRETWHCPKCLKTGKVLPEFQLTFHDLRKTWETHMYRLTRDLLSTARMGGHAAEVAARTYIGSDEQELHALASGLDFGNSSPPCPRLKTSESVNNRTQDVVEMSAPHAMGAKRK